MDAIGDLYGYNLIGEFVGFKSGHTENHLLRKALLENASAWELVTFGDDATVPPAYAGSQSRSQLASGNFSFATRVPPRLFSVLDLTQVRLVRLTKRGFSDIGVGSRFDLAHSVTLIMMPAGLRSTRISMLEKVF